MLQKQVQGASVLPITTTTSPALMSLLKRNLAVTPNCRNCTLLSVSTASSMLRKGGAPKSWRDEFTKLRDGELHASPTPPIYTQSSVAPATAAAWRVPPTQPRISHPSPRPSNLQPSSRIPPSQPTSVGEMATFPQDIPSIQIDQITACSICQVMDWRPPNSSSSVKTKVLYNNTNYTCFIHICMPIKMYV